MTEQLKEFRIPLHFKDLELFKEERYCVENKKELASLDEKSQGSLLDEITKRTSQDILTLSRSENFDVLYSFVCAFDSLTSRMKGRLVDLLATLLVQVVDSIQGKKAGRRRGREVEEAEGSETLASLAVLRNTYKMATCLLFHAASTAEAAYQLQKKDIPDMSQSSTAQAQGAGKGKKKKAEKAADSSFEWEGELQLKAAQSLLYGTAAITNQKTSGFKSIWSLGVPDEEFVLLFPRFSYQVLELPANTQSRAKELKQVMLKLIAEPFHRIPTLNVLISPNLIELVRKFEHFPSVIADLCQLLLEEYDDSRLTPEILRDIGKMDFSGPGTREHEAKPIANIASLVSELAEKLPAQVLSQISVLLPHFDSEPYSIRSALCSSISSIVTKLFNGTSEKRGTKEMQTRDSLLELLVIRIKDVNSFVRAAVLRAWAGMVTARALPLDRVIKVVQIAGDRLKDKTIAVRRNAIQLLTCLLENNPYLNCLDPELYQDKLNSVQAELDELLLQEREEQMRKLTKDAVGGASPMDEIKEETEEEAAMLNNEEEREHNENSCDEEEENEIEQDMITEEGIIPEEADGTDAVAGQSKSELEIAIEKKTREFEYFVSALAFIKEYEELKTPLLELLKSRAATDVTEAVELFIQAEHFGLSLGYYGVLDAMHLVWYDDEKVKEAATNCFLRIYVWEPGSNKPLKPEACAEKFVEFVKRANIAELTSMEVILTKAIKDKQIDPEVFDVLWYFVKDSRATGEVRGCALHVIAMAAAADSSVIDDPVKLKDILQYGLGDRSQKERDWHTIRCSCVALQKCLGVFEAGEGRGLRGRTQTIESILERLSQFVQGLWCANSWEDAEQWFAAAQHAIGVIFKLSPRPEELCSSVVKAMGDSIFKKDTCTPYRLARFFFVLGHVLMSVLIYSEEMVSRLKKAIQAKPKTDAEEQDGIGEEVDKAGEADAEQDKRLAEIQDKELVFRNLASCYVPVLVKIVSKIVSNDSTFSHPLLREVSVLALAKIMCISETFCEENLSLLFTVLERASEVSVRTNIVVSVGDLAVRFPNAVEPWTKFVYARLKDSSSVVRAQTMLVLTHLILNDMFKAKGQISEIALCLVDDDERIKGMAKHFFQELSNRTDSNPVYNQLPDIISTLMSSEEVTDDTFKTVLGQLLKYIKKDKQSEALVEKLCQRFAATDDLSQKRKVAYCISQLNINDKCIQKLEELLKCYKDFLYDNEVYASFENVGKKAKKFSKQETKESILNWEKTIKNYHEGKTDDDLEVSPDVALPTVPELEEKPNDADES